MSSQLLAASLANPQPLTLSETPWYAIRTRSKFEKAASAGLAGKGYEQYLPLYRAKRRWSDRVVYTDMPLFAGYVFCRFDPRWRLPILTTPGVVTIVGFGEQPAAIPDEEIDAIQAILGSGVGAEIYPFLKEGQRVRVTHGSLMDLEGILVKKKSDWRLVVSVTLLQRSVSVEIDRDCVTTI